MKIATLNVENIKTNIEYVHHLLKRVDILCVQEHWLYNFEEPLLKQLIPHVCYHLKCVDDDDPISPLLKPKGVAGVLTMWNPKIDHMITAIADGSPRCAVIQIGSGVKPTFLINSYLPTEGTPDYYRQESMSSTKLHKNTGSIPS